MKMNTKLQQRKGQGQNGIIPMMNYKSYLSKWKNSLIIFSNQRNAYHITEVSFN